MLSFFINLALALIVLPIGYVMLCRWMQRKVPNPPKLAFFFVFGTVGGYFLCRAISGNFFALFVAVLFFPAAFIALSIGLIRSLRAPARTPFHRGAAVASGALLLSIIWLATTPDLGGMTYAGTWDDDPGNWSRAMGGMPVPPEVKVIRSRYARTPHFTYEAYYYLQLAAPEKFLQDWIAFQKLHRSEPTKEDDPDQPAWFIPGDLADYDLWRPPNADNDRFRLYRHKTSGALFVADRQGM